MSKLLALGVGRDIDKRTDQSEQGLLLWLFSPVAQEGAEFDVASLSSRRAARLVDNECPAVAWFAAEVPRLAASGLIKLSSI
ncbi:hypothetical protein HCU64_19610 [Methylobacterium sp. C25]|nr:hypothetical protein [Methylobacterium sp. C25]